MLVGEAKAKYELEARSSEEAHKAHESEDVRYVTAMKKQFIFLTGLSSKNSFEQSELSGPPATIGYRSNG